MCTLRNANASRLAAGPSSNRTSDSSKEALGGRPTNLTKSNRLGACAKAHGAHPFRRMVRPFQAGFMAGRHSYFAALPAYFGGKRRLCPLIFALIAEVLPRTEWARAALLDPFCGGGAVSLHAKAQGFEVVASDLSERSTVVARALIANSSTRLARNDILDLFRPATGDCPLSPPSASPAFSTRGRQPG